MAENLSNYVSLLPHLINEEVYNKLLFKTISFHDLKLELKRRSIPSLLSDTYYILTLKLRLEILKESKVDLVHVQPLIEEIDYFYSQQRKSKLFECCLIGCPFKARDHKDYVKHLRVLHTNSKQKVECKLRGCGQEFSGVQMLEMHIKIVHRSRQSLVKLNQNQIVEQFSHLRCLSSSCQHQVVQNIKELKKHVGIHFERLESVSCFFAGCDYESTVLKTFQKHISHKHKLQDLDALKPNIVGEGEVVAEITTEVADASFNSEIDSTHENVYSEDLDEEEESEHLSELSEDEHLDVFLKAVAIKFNDWMNVKNIPYSTCNMIIQEVFNSYSDGKAASHVKIKKCLEDEGWGDERIEELLQKISKDDPFKVARDALESEKSRLNFIKDKFEHIEPETIYLDKKQGESYQYVSLLKSMKVLLEDETFLKQKQTDPYFAEEGIYQDVRDGEFYKSNPFFSSNPEAVPILLFQDELELANPLGSGKTKHKINATYLTTYEVQGALRSRIRSVQLVSLIRSKFWKTHGNLKSNQKLLDDLKHLEEVGVEVNKPIKKVVKAGLIAFVGDNLGLHQLGEYNACFSSGHICRVCKATYREVCKENKLYAGIEDGFNPETFTKSVYDNLADAADLNGGGGPDTCGIKTHCIFNSLQAFHSSRGLPPCLGHDFLEGLFSYDVQFLVDYIINKEKLLSVQEFNANLSKCKLSERDARNRPNPFKHRAKNSKYEGSAGQLRVLSRIMTVVLSPIIDQSEEAGKMIIKLQEVAEIVTAPKLTLDEIEQNMTEIIESYLDMRISAISSLDMPNTRPKHHYLSHYPECFKNYGPLISVWAMRMESKHTYFKSVLRASKNFKNVSKTCATRYYGLFPVNKFEFPANSAPLDSHVNTSSDTYIGEASLLLDKDSLILTSLKIYGTLYRPGSIILMKKESLGVLKIGLVRIIAYESNRIFFGCSTYIAMQSRYNFYVTTEELKSFEIISYDNLQDYYPLMKIGTTSGFKFSLHHFISSGSVE